MVDNANLQRNIYIFFNYIYIYIFLFTAGNFRCNLTTDKEDCITCVVNRTLGNRECEVISTPNSTLIEDFINPKGGVCTKTVLTNV
jgi:hypothetical protein